MRAGRCSSGPELDARASTLSMPPSPKLRMEDEQRFEFYRLTYVESLPDSDWKDALVEAIKHKLKLLNAECPSENWVAFAARDANSKFGPANGDLL